MLSKKCQYAIHALIYLAENQHKETVLIQEISEEKNIPKKFLEAILLELKKAGVLSSKKGKGGGYYLLMPPEKIKVLDVVRLFDGAVAMLPCVSLNFYETCGFCENEKKCTINNLFKQVRDATIKILSTKSIEDLVGQ